MQRIDADIAIVGDGTTISNATILLQDKKIVYVGATALCPNVDCKETVKVATVMPGMWDSHCHLLGVLTPAIAQELPRNPVCVASARCTADLRAAVDAGFTSVREVGGIGVDLAIAVKEGSILGPNIYGAGSILSPTGGHADIHSLPEQCVTSLCGHGGCDGRWFGVTCDGIPECLKAVRLQIRRNAQVIKICASGGVLTEVDDPHDQQFSDEELRAIVEEATRNRRAVAAHCHGKAGIMAALKAGCLTIEHGSYLDEESVSEMKKRGAILVPTRFVIDTLLPELKAGRLPAYMVEKGIATADSNAKSMRLAHEHGVPIALGTDIMTSGPKSTLPWGRHASELKHLMTIAGMTAMEAIISATSNGPRTLGPRAPKSGMLRDGYDADVIAIQGNPLDDIDVLCRPGNITHVWIAGTCVKRDGMLLK